RYTFNAVAYHTAKASNVVDLSTDESPQLFHDHVAVSISNVGNYYTCQEAIDIHHESSVFNGTNSPITLSAGKEMGLSVAYCDNDGTGVRETFMGSDPNSTSEDRHWFDAGELANLTLVGADITSTRKINSNGISVFPVPA